MSKPVALVFLTFILLLLGSFIGIFISAIPLQKFFVSGATLSTGAILMFLVVWSIYTGEFAYGRPGLWRKTILRKTRPFGFWFVTGTFSIFSSILLILGGSLLISACSSNSKLSQTNITQSATPSLIKVLVKADGTTSTIQILQSCGHMRCDQAALQTIKIAQLPPPTKDELRQDHWVIFAVHDGHIDRLSETAQKSTPP